MLSYINGNTLFLGKRLAGGQNTLMFFALIVLQRNCAKSLGPCLGGILEEQKLEIKVRHGKCSQQPEPVPASQIFCKVTHHGHLILLPVMVFLPFLASATPYSSTKSLLKYHFLRETVPNPHLNWLSTTCMLLASLLSFLFSSGKIW